MQQVKSNDNQAVMVTLECSDPKCYTRLRLGRFIRLPITRVGPLQFCPVCGSKAVVSKDNNEDYWESLAKQYNLPVEGIIAIYSVWDSRAQPSFGAFVEEMKKEAELIK